MLAIRFRVLPEVQLARHDQVMIKTARGTWHVLSCRKERPSCGWLVLAFIRPISGFDSKEHTCWDNQALKRVGGAVVPFGDVDDALVRSDFELLARLLVNKW
jgi:hypothetical protein